MSPASTVPSLLAVATPAPMYTTVVVGANYYARQHANFHLSTQIVSGLVIGPAIGRCKRPDWGEGLQLRRRREEKGAPARVEFLAAALEEKNLHWRAH
jgi:hypothetical protein